MKNICRFGFLLSGILILVAATELRANEVGRFAIVQGEVTSLKPESTHPIDARPGAVIVLDEEEVTGPASAAKMIFGEWGVVSVGQKTRFKVTEETVEEATGRSVSRIGLFAGKLRVFVSRFWSGRPEVRIDTPTAVVGVKGSEVVIEIFDDGRVVISVLSGSATVDPKEAAAASRTLGPAQAWTIPPNGGPATAPTSLDDSSMDRLRGDTEPDPDGGPDDPPASDPPPLATAGGGNFFTNTAAVSSAGFLFASPSSTAIPQRVIPQNPSATGMAFPMPPMPPVAPAGPPPGN